MKARLLIPILLVTAPALADDRPVWVATAPRTIERADWVPVEFQNRQYPRFKRDQVILLPDNRYSASGGVWYRPSLSPPFEVSFEYRTFDDDAGSRHSSADGIVVMFCKDARDYGALPTGGSRGFAADGTGYGVHFKTYAGDEIQLTDGHRGVLTGVPQHSFPSRYPRVYTGGLWRRVILRVTRSRVTVRYEGHTVIDWQGPVSPLHKGFGFAAATGASDSDHRLRRIKLTLLSPLDPRGETLGPYLETLDPTHPQHLVVRGWVAQLADSDPAVRKGALDQLYQLPVLPVQTLLEASHHPQVDVRFRVRAVLSYARGFRTTPDLSHRVLASIHLHRVPGLASRLIKVLLALKSTDPLVPLASQALSATTRPADRELLERWSTSGPRHLREAASRALKSPKPR